eukprot:3581582-Pleurochrysis_carterae.AAC.1
MANVNGPNLPTPDERNGSRQTDPMKQSVQMRRNGVLMPCAKRMERKASERLTLQEVALT